MARRYNCRLIAALLVSPLLPLPSMLAQQVPAQAANEKSAVTGTITGHVYGADTNAPVRLANVTLEAASDVDAANAGDRNGPTMHITQVQTLLDGSFAFQHVAAGTYYVVASAPGYVSPLAGVADSDEQLYKPDKDTKEKYAKLVPRASVQGNLPAAVEIRLERGAAISGVVRYDDGSPAAGLEVSVLVRQKETWVPLSTHDVLYPFEKRTDDMGSYRISGLPSREYLLEVDLHVSKALIEKTGGGTAISSGAEYTLPIYTGGRFRTKDAKPFKLKLGEERSGEDLEINLSKLHTVSGTIIALHDGHVVNGGGLQLLYPDDRTEVARTELSKDRDGFTFSFVPEGDYVLTVPWAADVEYLELQAQSGMVLGTPLGDMRLHTYGSTEKTIHIEGDVSGLTIAVPDQPTKK